jgi:phosphoribosylformylglycinamidine synthase
MPKTGVLDPQGKAIGNALEGLGFGGVRDVRAGKVIELDLAEADPAQAKQIAEDMAHKCDAYCIVTNAVRGSVQVTIEPTVSRA